jgi:poly-gamma-glutamate capsule biosynthesis protein CapA/YwtB (metallophosphatase superfamily)
VKIFLAGDVMTGRGVDQVLPYPCAPGIYEPAARSANEYVQLAEQANGRILRPVSFEYPWGAALAEIRSAAPVIYLVNLETAITRSEDFLPNGINYRMSPDNAQCLAAAGINCCVLESISKRGLRGLLLNLRLLFSLHSRIPTNEGLPELVIEYLRPHLE